MSAQPFALAVALASTFACAACTSSRPARALPSDEPRALAPVEPERAPPVGDAIVVCGRRFELGVPVVLWSDPGGYDASTSEPRFPNELGDQPPPQGLRYRPGREAAGDSRELSLDALADIVDLLVVHYDACGTSRRCFQVLHDRRGLSVHFLLDLDGTLYQTLDLAHTAWHARQANPRSIGIEIANVGAFAPGERSPLDEWYTEDERGPRVRLPAGETLRDPEFVARPARAERVRGELNGHALEMHDLTPEQYATLARLAAKLCELFPRIEPEAPRDATGRVRTTALTNDELAQFHGILGHLHVTTDKVDPGPAFDWERFLGDVRARLAHDRAAAAP